MTKASLKMLVVVPGIILICHGPVLAKDRDMGKIEYQSRCAVCHGPDGKGNGPMASQLRTAPSDLTQISKKNGGVFPVSVVYEVIDGRQEVKAHGPRDMPVWGERYVPSLSLSPKRAKSWKWADMPDPEPIIRTRILGLIDYLSRIQER